MVIDTFVRRDSTVFEPPYVGCYKLLTHHLLIGQLAWTSALYPPINDETLR